MLVDSQLTNSSVNGIRADGAGVMVGVAVTNNGTGLAAPNGSVLGTYGNNGVKVNTTDGNFTVPITLR